MDNSHPPEGPSLNQLRYFALLAKERSFTRAAAELSISQPALSRQIALLERRLGTRLLERAPSGVALSAAGRALLPEVQAALSLTDRIVRMARQVDRLEAGVLEIATYPGFVSGFLLPSIQRWNKEHADVKLRFNEFAHRKSMQEFVRNGGSDLAIGTAPIDWTGLQRKLGWNELVIVLPAGDPLHKQREDVDLKQLAGRDWVLYSRENGLSDVVISACVRAGFHPTAAIETAQVDVAAQLAAAGLGPALVPLANVSPALAGYTRRLVPAVAWEVVAFTRTAWSAAASRFLEIATQELRSGLSRRASRRHPA